MHPHLVGLKFAITNMAISVVPAAAVVKVSEIAAHAQAQDQALYRTAAIMGIASSAFGIAWYSFMAVRFYRAWRRERAAKREGRG